MGEAYSWRSRRCWASLSRGRGAPTRRSILARQDHSTSHHPLDALAGPAEGLDGGVLGSSGFAAAVERALAHAEPRAVVLIELGAAELVDFPGGAVGALTAAAEARILRTIRPDDVLGRLDNRRFAVLTGQDGAARVAIRLGERLREPFNVGDTHVRLVPQVGVGYAGPDVQTAEAMLREAQRSPRY